MQSLLINNLFIKLYNYFKKYQSIHYKERVPKRNIDPKEIQDFMEKQKKIVDAKKSGIPISTSSTAPKQIDKPKEDVVKISSGSTSTNPQVREDKGKVDLSQASTTKTEVKLSSTVSNSSNENNDNSQNENIDLGKVDLNKKKAIESKKEVFSAISTYNGDSCDLYNWSQGTNDVQIQIKLPENTGAKKVSFFIL